MSHTVELIELRLNHMASLKQLEEKGRESVQIIENVLKEKYITED